MKILIVSFGGGVLFDFVWGFVFGGVLVWGFVLFFKKRIYLQLQRGKMVLIAIF